MRISTNKILNFIFLLVIVTGNLNCKGSSSPEQPQKSKQVNANAIEFKELDSYEYADCLLEPFENTSSIHDGQVILTNIRDLKLNYDCIVYITTVKVKELETYFQSYDLIISNKKLLSITASNTPNNCPGGLKSIKLNSDQESTNLKKIFIYGVKPKKTYTNLTCS